MNRNPHMLALAKKVLHRNHTLRDFQIMHPRRDWFIGVGIATLLFIAGAAFSAYTYITNIEVSQTLTEIPEEVVVYRESVVDAALLRLRERQTIFMSVLGSPATQPIVVPAATSSPVSEEEANADILIDSELIEATTSVESGVILPAPL